MKLLNKLNGWQRLWLLATVAFQIVAVFNWSAHEWPAPWHCNNWDKEAFACLEVMPLQEVIMVDLLINGLALGLSVAGYVAALLAVIIVRWVISGFKKNN